VADLHSKQNSLGTVSAACNIYIYFFCI